MRLGRFIAITCVARMCASSVVPQPKASAPSPPTVLAWLSGTAWVAPGSTMPSSGATTCEMPCSGSPRSKMRMPFRRLPSRMARRNGAPSGLVVSSRPGLVGDGVVLHREGEVRPPHRAVLLLQRLEGVRGVQLVQHVAVDIDEIAPIGARAPRDAASQILSNKVCGMGGSFSTATLFNHGPRTAGRRDDTRRRQPRTIA
mgnify:CR=1 FL=1